MPHAALVLGGSGFIGSHLLRRLADEGRHRQLIAIDRAPPSRPIENVTYLQHDIRSGLPAEVGDHPVETIYNLAALHRTPGHADWEYFDTNLACAIETCRFASSVGVANIVFTSSIAVYGASTQSIDETATPSPTTAYGRSKLRAEQVHSLWQAERPDARRITIVRPGAVYGAGERGNFTRLARQIEQRRFVYPGRKDTIKACGYVKDLVDSMLFVQQRNEGSVTYNFCHPTPPTIEDICLAFCAIGGNPPPRWTLPQDLALAAACAAECLSLLGLAREINRARVLKLLNPTPIVPKRLQEVGYPFKFDLQSSLKDWFEETGRRCFE